MPGSCREEQLIRQQRKIEGFIGDRQLARVTNIDLKEGLSGKERFC